MVSRRSLAVTWWRMASATRLMSSWESMLSSAAPIRRSMSASMMIEQKHEKGVVGPTSPARHHVT
jgi:hypothetical protein